MFLVGLASKRLLNFCEQAMVKYAIISKKFVSNVMVSIYLLIPLSLMLSAVAIWAIIYAVKSNQFEDLDNASEQIVLDDRQERRQNNDKSN